MTAITQADREAAASGYFAWCSGNPVIPDKMRAGKADDHSMVQAFARHREAVFAYLIAKAQGPVEIFTGSFAKPLHADERTAWLKKMQEEYDERHP